AAARATVRSPRAAPVPEAPPHRRWANPWAWPRGPLAEAHPAPLRPGLAARTSRRPSAPARQTPPARSGSWPPLPPWPQLAPGQPDPQGHKRAGRPAEQRDAASLEGAMSEAGQHRERAHHARQRSGRSQAFGIANHEIAFGRVRQVSRKVAQNPHFRSDFDFADLAHVQLSREADERLSATGDELRNIL